jgi:predicted aspartyl protease
VIRGVVRDGVPVIEVMVAGRPWEALIDTGFNGDLELPYELERAVNPRFMGRGVSFLAGDQQVWEDHYYVDFPFDGRVVHVVATFSLGDGILIGTRLLQRYRLEVDFSRMTVKLERVA